MTRIHDSLFARLFAAAIIAIVIAHLLAIFWFQQIQNETPAPQPSVEQAESGQPGPPFDKRIIIACQLLLLIMFAWMGSRLLVKPVRLICDTAERLGGDIDSPALEIKGLRESREVARNFNAMQNKIRGENHRQALAIWAVSHDLRTPLTRLRLRLESVEDEQLLAQLRQDLNEATAIVEGCITALRTPGRNG